MLGLPQVGYGAGMEIEGVLPSFLDLQSRLPGREDFSSSAAWPVRNGKERSNSRKPSDRRVKH
jgi:hypothetical protein